MSALGALALGKAETVAKAADIAGAMTLEALRGTDAPYLPMTHRVRPHPRAAGYCAETWCACSRTAKS